MLRGGSSIITSDKGIFILSLTLNYREFGIAVVSNISGHQTTYRLQAPNCAWHPVPQYASEEPHQPFGEQQSP